MPGNSLLSVSAPCRKHSRTFTTGSKRGRARNPCRDAGQMRNHRYRDNLNQTSCHVVDPLKTAKTKKKVIDFWLPSVPCGPGVLSSAGVMITGEKLQWIRRARESTEKRKSKLKNHSVAGLVQTWACLPTLPRSNVICPYLVGIILMKCPVCSKPSRTVNSSCLAPLPPAGTSASKFRSRSFKHRPWPRLAPPRFKSSPESDRRPTYQNVPRHTGDTPRPASHPNQMDTFAVTVERCGRAIHLSLKMHAIHLG